MSQSKIIAGDASNGMVQTAGDDGTLVLQSGAAGAKVDALKFAADGTPTFLKVPVNSTVQSMVRVNTANGYGSTNTRIRRFTNVVTNQGSDIAYVDSATLGGTFTINTNGVYALQYNDQFTGLTNMGWSLNSSQLTTSILSLTTADILCIQDTAGANNVGNAAWVGYLAAGAIVRCHTSGSATGVNTNGCQATVARVA